MANRFLLIGLFILTALQLSCVEEYKVEAPADLMSEDLYLDIFLELELLKVYYDPSLPPQKPDSLLNAIWDKYDISKEEFLTSHQFYQSQVAAQQVRVDSVIKRIDRLMVLFENVQDSTEQLKGPAPVQLDDVME
ncbi:hypothetical protein [Balneola vulgaris]|uniref:hypothetical protein n=1 Tax=Balneola vulgaris TaxID=287535 RepID=UPI00036A1539|nr:hypothetical protein [Balneola vulgaris]